jgi:hypothetical protein
MGTNGNGTTAAPPAPADGDDDDADDGVRAGLLNEPIRAIVLGRLEIGRSRSMLPSEMCVRLLPSGAPSIL